MNLNKNMSIILAPFGIGGPNDAAKDGPRSVMNNGLKKDLEELEFNINAISPPKKLISKILKLKSSKKNKIKNIDAVLKINEWLSDSVFNSAKNGYIPLTIGGDHSLAIGTISGITSALNNVGVLWIDRHFDAHSPKNTPSWRAHGMPVALAIANKDFDSHTDFQRLLRIGRSNRLPKIKSDNFVHFGIGEKSIIKPKTKWFLMEDIDNTGIKKAIDDAINYLLKRVKYIYIAWDIDSMSVTGTGTHADDQLSLREGLVVARAINNKIRLKVRLAGFEMMEVAPKLEKKYLKGQTAEWAIKLITTSFGGNLFNNYSRLTSNINIHAE